jgi:hypothetical protein
MKSTLLVIIICLVQSAFGRNFYISRNGSDNNTGTSYASPWQTLDKVNTTTFLPGDSILFRRGDAWRGQLIPQSGSSEGDIVYNAYGTGSKPLLLGSIEKNNPADWITKGNNIWETGEAKSTGEEILPNPDFDKNTEGWYLWIEGGANATGSRDSLNYDSPPAGYRIDCISSGNAYHHIQFSTASNISISQDKTYKLKFSARCTESFVIPGIYLIKSSHPWDNYSGYKPCSPAITEQWNTYITYFKANTEAPDAKIVFFLGNLLPEGKDFFIDSISLTECEEPDLHFDIGNIIFNNEETCGIKIWDGNDLDEQGEFWYDPGNKKLKIYSTSNPAQYYNDIECAITSHIIDESNKHHIIYQNIELKYGGAHGIGGTNTHHITVRDCDFSYIGGGELIITGYENIRFGNGIEFWGNAQNNLVVGCRLWEIYDAALTNQNQDQSVVQSNIIYRNNTIRNCEYSFEYWNRPEESTTDSIFFLNNTCVNAGSGWGHDQRPDPSGRHLCFFYNSANTNNFIIKNNIFYEASEYSFYLWPYFSGLENLELDYNCWYKTNGDIINYGFHSYNISQFTEYQLHSSQDLNSITENPLFSDPANNDYYLSENSPCIDRGDPQSQSDPDNTIADIGAYYFNQLGTNYDDQLSSAHYSFSLYQNFPNPFNRSTVIRYTLKTPAHVILKIYNIRGDELETIVNKKQNSGRYRVTWNTQGVSSGIYFYRLHTEEYTDVKKMMMIK